MTLPFVVRTVQPVLLELDREMEEAAASLGAGRSRPSAAIVFPNLLPAILSGVALAFARAIGEFGSVVLISGNLPFKTEVASVYIFGRIESGDPPGAAAVVGRDPRSSRFAVLLAIGGSAPLGDEARSCAKSVAPLRRRSATWRLLLAAPVGLVFWRTFEHGFGAGLGRGHDAGRAARASG